MLGHKLTFTIVLASKRTARAIYLERG